MIKHITKIPSLSLLSKPQKIILSLATASLLSISLSAQTFDIQNNWKLLGAMETVDVSKFDNKCVDFVWKYVPTDTVNPWKIHIANGQTYAGTNSFGTFTSIGNGEGFWVKGNNSCSINVTDTTSIEKTGYLIDSPVQGINCTCGTISDVTNSEGKFTYDANKCPTGVEFKLGSLSLGTITPSAINSDTYLTIQELAGTTRDNVTDENVVKLAVLLQSLDSDNNASNGIDINSTVRTNFSLTGNISDINDTALQTEIGSHGKAKKTRYEALKHLLDYTKSIDATVTTRLDNKSLLRTGQTASYATYDDGWYASQSTPLGIARTFTRDDTKNIVTDNATLLQWQDGTTPATMNWANANTYCIDLDFGGYSDWRLPTVEELMTITNKGAVNPSKFTEFANIVSNYYWSSSTYASDTSRAWGVTFGNGADYWDPKTTAYYVRCVRAGQ